MSAFGVLMKKLISALLYPLGLSLLMLIGGTLVWCRRPKSRLGPLMLWGGILLLVLMSFPITGFILLCPLEMEAGDYANPSVLAARRVECVVVLGATTVNASLSVADRWREEGLLRLMEGIRLWREIPGSKLILCGGSLLGRQSDAEAMTALPHRLGVPRESLVLETRAADTIQEATLLEAKLGKEKPFALVTSALHMPRSMEIFRSLGMKPVACPCAFRTKLRPSWYTWFVPDVSDGLRNSHVALHEYLGRLWLFFREGVLGWKMKPNS
jgi:uncharacterized SAM-binding protein YcdF (DUF218 family)